MGSQKTTTQMVDYKDRRIVVHMNSNALTLAKEALDRQEKSFPITPYYDTDTEKVCARLSISEICYLKDALVDYANSQFREGSSSYQVVKHFTAALEDHVLTRQEQDDKAELLNPFEPEKNEVAEAAELSLRKANQLRDQMLHEVFVGGPHKRLNIWGEVIEEDPEYYRRRAKGITTQAWQEAVRQDFADLRRQQRGTDTSSDTVADTVLTGGVTMTYNEDMKIEGSSLLIAKQTEDRRVVYTVSSFLKKVKESLGENC